MNDDKRALLDQVEKDREPLIDFFSRFVRAASPNPPGDTREAVAHIRTFLDSRDLPYRIIDPKPEFPNVVGSFEGAAPGCMCRSKSAVICRDFLLSVLS